MNRKILTKKKRKKAIPIACIHTINTRNSRQSRFEWILMKFGSFAIE